MQAEALVLQPTHIKPEQYNTRDKSTISRKLLKMDVLTFKTCRIVNSEIASDIKLVYLYSTIKRRVFNFVQCPLSIG